MRAPSRERKAHQMQTRIVILFARVTVHLIHMASRVYF